jgi:hypothetical protein
MRQRGRVRARNRHKSNGCKERADLLCGALIRRRVSIQLASDEQRACCDFGSVTHLANLSCAVLAQWCDWVVRSGSGVA